MARKFLIKVTKTLLRALQPVRYVNVETKTVYAGDILRGKNIVITGGGRGLGFAMAKKFVSEGARVVLAGRNKERLEEAVKTLGYKSKYVVFDVTNTKNCPEFLNECRTIFEGPIHCLVSNAGISFHEANILKVTEDGFDQQFNTNLRSCYFLCQSFIKDIVEKKERDANILIISSETADMAYDIPYGMTKAGLSTLTRALSVRYYTEGLRVNAIAPGVTLSDMTKYAGSEDGNMSRNNAAGRVFLPEEVAEVACFLVSDASKCISGEVIHTNAGNHLRAFWINNYGN